MDTWRKAERPQKISKRCEKANQTIWLPVFNRGGTINQESMDKIFVFSFPVNTKLYQSKNKLKNLEKQILRTNNEKDEGERKNGRKHLIHL